MSDKPLFGGMTIDASEPIKTNWGGPAFPRNILDHGHGVKTVHESGMTLRQYAAIHLKVPDSGTDWLDDMIRKSQRDDIAAKAMQGLSSDPNVHGTMKEFARRSYEMADTMLKEREKS